MKRLKRESWTRNRDIARYAKRGKYWCDVCDHQLVGQGQSCPNCGCTGRKDERKRRYRQIQGTLQDD